MCFHVFSHSLGVPFIVTTDMIVTPVTDLHCFYAFVLFMFNFSEIYEHVLKSSQHHKEENELQLGNL